MAEFRVVYSVSFECTINAPNPDELGDAISNINIPEGGANGSVYCEGSFSVTETVECDK